MNNEDARLVRFATTEGCLTVMLESERAPVTTANFRRHLHQGILDNAAIYRIVTRANQNPQTPHPIEVIEWGRPYRKGVPDPAFATIAHESTKVTGLRHRHGTLSMARFALGSACSNFFFCIGDQPSLDHGGGRHPDGKGFAAFGQVIDGWDTLTVLHNRARTDEYLDQPLWIRPVSPR